MNEQTLITAMRIAIEDEPVPSVDPDRLVDLAVRRRQQVRSSWLAGGAVAIVAVGAIAVAAPRGGGAQPVVPGSPSAAQVPPADPDAYLELRGKEMSRYLRQRLPAVVPGATDIRGGAWEAFVGTNTPAISTTTNATVTFAVGEKHYRLYVHVATPWGLREKAGDVCIFY